MGYAKKRVGKDGKPRYTAVYVDLQDRERSAGTFATKKEANDKWREAEVKQAEGRGTDPRRGRQRFRAYVEQTWLPNHVIEVSTLEGYTYQINRHIVPHFGNMRMIDILPSHVREWVTKLRNAGVRPKNLSSIKLILSAIFTTAFTDKVIFLHPCAGVKVPTAPTRPLTIITPEQFDLLHAALETPSAQLLAETEIETGFRWGELTKLRVKDWDSRTRTFVVSRAVVQVDPKFHPNSERFLVKEYPKDGEWRRVKVSKQLGSKIDDHIRGRGLPTTDLLFPYEPEPRLIRARAPESMPDDLGFTDTTGTGKAYRHGTVVAYNAAMCRCRCCRDAVARYRAARRAHGVDQPRKSRTAVVDTDGHIPRDWFRNKIWRPALHAAQIELGVTMRDLRHAHASWLLAGGADIQVVKERLGHGSISTTQRYLHTLPDNDETAIDAFNAVRRRSHGRG
jgi:integrase